MTSDDGELDFEFKLREKESELELGTRTNQLLLNKIYNKYLVLSECQM